MTNPKVHGAIDQTHIQRKDDYLFRISIKGLIFVDDRKVLVVKEGGRTWWDLPGGGMDHDESIKTALQRELSEEVGLTGDFSYRVIAVEEPKLLNPANVWQVRLVFQVIPENLSFECGADGDELCFIDPRDLEGSDNSVERRIYEYASLVAPRPV